MATFDYRAIDARGGAAQGQIDAPDRAQAVAAVRRLGVAPVAVMEASAANPPARGLSGGRARAAVSGAIDDLGALLDAGLPLDRALALCIDNIEYQPVAAEFRQLHGRVREGAPLSIAMAERGALFPATAQAMAEAGEANGRLGDALSRVARMLLQADEMRRLVTGAMIYPAALLVIAVGVILMMLLFVVPQFESLFVTAQGRLPASSLALMAASRLLRDHGLLLLGGLIAAGFAVRSVLARPAVARAIDGWALRLPQIGPLLRSIETARFARTLGGLIEGEVPLPIALAMAKRVIANRIMAAAVADVADRVKEGGGLTVPLAATGALPRVAIGFFRTGEETSQLGPMLGRLADILDRDVKHRIGRLVAVATPVITVALGGAVAAIIASIMTAILGFNDLAVTQ